MLYFVQGPDIIAFENREIKRLNKNYTRLNAFQSRGHFGAREIFSQTPSRGFVMIMISIMPRSKCAHKQITIIRIMHVFCVRYFRENEWVPLINGWLIFDQLVAHIDDARALYYSSNRNRIISRPLDCSAKLQSLTIHMPPANRSSFRQSWFKRPTVLLEIFSYLCNEFECIEKFIHPFINLFLIYEAWKRLSFSGISRAKV